MKKTFLLIIFILNFENSYAENKIAYIDINHILNMSIVGQSISKHIKKIKEKKNNELVIIEKQLADIAYPFFSENENPACKLFI